MILLVGLGNPGAQYHYNRHNVGFLYLDALLHALSPSTSFAMEQKFNAEVASVKTEKETYIFVKPQTFMNKSGEAVQRVMAFYKIPLDNVWVAHDELDIPLGKIKIQIGTGPKLHNGLDSINTKLGNPNYHRIRIGVDNRDKEHRIPGESYVLQNFTQEEQAMCADVFAKITAQLVQFKLIPR